MTNVYMDPDTIDPDEITKPGLPRSIRYLNYAKLFGAIVTTSIAIGAFVIATWFNPEPVAKAGYKETEKSVTQLSDDIRRAFEVQEILNTRIDALQDQQRLLMDFIQIQLATVRQPARDRLSRQVEVLKPKVKSSKSPRSPKLKKLMKRPPKRKLPSFDNLQQKIQQQPAFLHKD